MVQGTRMPAHGRLLRLQNGYLGCRVRNLRNSLLVTAVSRQRRKRPNRENTQDYGHTTTRGARKVQEILQAYEVQLLASQGHWYSQTVEPLLG